MSVKPITWIPVIGITILFFGIFQTVIASEEGSNDELSSMQTTIQTKQNNVKDLNRQIDSYKKNIEQIQSQAKTLSNEMNLLGNRIAKTQLEIDSTNTEIDLTNIEINEVNLELMAIEQKINKDRSLIGGVLQKMQTQDTQLSIKIFFGSKRFSEIFDTIQHMEEINADLKQGLERVKREKVLEIEKRLFKEKKAEKLEQFQQTLDQEKIHLAAELESKQILITQTQKSEQRFQNLLRDVKQEQLFVENQIQELQSAIEKKIKPSESLNDAKLSWPLSPSQKGISVYFHDPTYPFRNLFEHSGIDIPAQINSPVQSAGPGYVAWTKRGTQYGNYVMVIHSDGIATLYAHLSKVLVASDQFVARGDVIGTVGMTGLTTGPHLHFEVRKNGLPTNPLPYLN